MSDTNDVILILHGVNGNKPEHWQEHVFRTLSEAGADVRYPKMPTPTDPKPTEWINAIQDTLDEIPDKSRLTVLAHSLGAISWIHVAAASAEKLADRVLLVAPPYIIPEVPPVDTPPGIGNFYPIPLVGDRIAAAANRTVIVAGDNDDYATFDQTSGYAQKLGIAVYKLPGAGHISPYWGYGEWPWVHDWSLRKAELPPQSR